MKKLKYLFLIIMVTFFTSVPLVKATAGEVNTQFYTSPLTSSSEAQFYNGSGSSITTNWRYYQNNLDAAGYYYASTDNVENILSFNTNKALASNNLYALTLFINHSNNVQFGNIHMKLGQGVWIGGSVSGFLDGTAGNTCQSEILSYTHSYNWTSKLVVGNDELGYPTVTADTGFVYVVFKTSCHHPYLAMNINFESSPGQISFYGFNLEHLGSADNLTSTQVENIVNNATSDLSTADDIQSAEENIKSQIEDSTNKIDNTITNSDVDSSTGSDFFDSFTTNDNGGISAIVTAPLSAIEKMVSGTCTPVRGSYKGKEFSFPCGDTFWADMPDVKQFLNVVLGGFLCYGILAKLYLLIDRLKDPEDDRVDVMKL